MNEEIKGQLKLLNQYSKEITAVYQSAAAKMGIAGNEFWVLYAMQDREFSQQEIGEMWSLPKQTVNSIITNLIKKNIVYLENLPGTRNKKIIRLTEYGKEFVKRKNLPIYEAEKRALAKSPASERETYIALSKKYLNHIREEVDKL